MLNTKNNFKALSLSTESEVLNSHKLHTCNNEKGRSMIEMLGVLAIIGVLSVGGIAGYSKAMMKFKTNKTIDQIAMTVTNIRTLFAQQSEYGFGDTPEKTAYDMGVVDDAMVVLDKDKKFSKLTNAFSGDVFIGTSSSGVQGTTTGAFLVTFAKLPREACVAIATNDWGSGYSSGLLGIMTGAADKTELKAAADITACTVNGGTDPTTGACAVGNVSAALSVSKAAAGCNCGTSNTCYVTFKYY